MWGQEYLKCIQKHVLNHAQKQVWAETSILNDMCLIHVSAKSTQKSKPFIASL